LSDLTPPSILPDEKSLIRAAQIWIEETPAPAFITLSGELGAGKSTFVRAVLRHMGFAGRVKSPTFSLLESYHFGDKCVHHMDLYRLTDPEELEFLGFRDLLADADYIFIEWPERGEGYLPRATHQIQIAYEGTGRTLQITHCHNT